MAYSSRLLRVCLVLFLSLAAHGARADAGTPVGEAILVSGDVWAESASGKAALKSGDRLLMDTVLQTAESGVVYIRMVDGGFFILRPGSRARIVSYVADLSTPGNSRLRLDLEHGHARAISGEAARRSPESFRLNTPVAAIGVRGTDFSVSTTADLTRVTVIEGAVVVDKLGSGCLVDALGPCRTAFAQTLLSTDKQALEVRRDETNLRRETLSETKSGTVSGEKTPVVVSSASTALSEILPERLRSAALNPANPSSTDEAPSVTPTPPQPAVVEPRHIFWGRWRTVSNLAPSVNVGEALKAGDGFSDWPIFSLWRDSVSTPTLPVQGQWTFQLAAHESYFLTGQSGDWTAQAAQLRDATLSIDLAKRSFSTQLTIYNNSASANLSAKGAVDASGNFLWEFSPTGNMSVRGLMAGTNGNQAGYLYSSQLGAGLWATGATYWTRP